MIITQVFSGIILWKSLLRLNQILIKEAVECLEQTGAGQGGLGVLERTDQICFANLKDNELFYGEEQKIVPSYPCQ